MIDLHTHSTASDGKLSPCELVQYGKSMGLEAIAITDHDTVEGIEEAIESGIETGIEVVPGIEISAEYPDNTLHILGYYMDYKDESFLKNISILQAARNERNPRIAKKLQGLGVKIEFEEVVEEAGSGLVGRPHFAQVLLKKGYVKNTREAFDKYLKKGAPAYEDKFRFQPEAAISNILEAGGIPVLAHPSTLGCRTTADLEKAITSFVNYGLRGIEAYYSEHSQGQVNLYKDIAEKYRLLITGGSDFHGHNIKGVKLGKGKNNLSIPYSILANLKKSRQAIQANQPSQ